MIDVTAVVAGMEGLWPFCERDRWPERSRHFDAGATIAFRIARLYLKGG